jgi:hypothetical protein
MYVADGVSDMDEVLYMEWQAPVVEMLGVQYFTGDVGENIWFFSRNYSSIHNTTSPDIMIETY